MNEHPYIVLSEKEFDRIQNRVDEGSAGLLLQGVWDMWVQRGYVQKGVTQND